MSNITIIKHNTQGQETWRYSGAVLRRTPTAVMLQAYFNRDDLPFHGIVLGKGDRFIEIWFADRWYNINEIHDRQDDHLKGWYCNVTRPAEISDGVVSYIDLALDLLVYPDHHYLALDEDEFLALDLPAETAQSARAALAELQALFVSTAEMSLDRLL